MPPLPLPGATILHTLLWSRHHWKWFNTTSNITGEILPWLLILCGRQICSYHRHCWCSVGWYTTESLLSNNPGLVILCIYLQHTYCLSYMLLYSPTSFPIILCLFFFAILTLCRIYYAYILIITRLFFRLHFCPYPPFLLSGVSSSSILVKFRLFWCPYPSLSITINIILYICLWHTFCTTALSHIY